MTILHVSDTQFGRHHRFSDGEHDSLAGRLLQWLADPPPGAEVPAVDLVVLSGDIAEWGMASEFDQARAFVDRLCIQLGLDHDRVVVVPGNHDVNRKLCQSYVLEQEANGDQPVAPYAKKWLPYEAFVRNLHGDAAFSADRPYRLHVLADLGVVVAALNSTIEETHEQHYGWCGEEQLRWFAEQLMAYRQFHRIGVVHHNVRRGAENDDENLRDADLFTQVLGPHLDLVLHGHTHHGQRDHLSDGTLVLATGSAAVQPAQRPGEVPNQCQILRLAGESVTRWALRYQPDKRQWEGDTSASRDGSSWVEHIHLRLSPDCRDTLAGEPRRGRGGAGTGVNQSLQFVRGALPHLHEWDAGVVARVQGVRIERAFADLVAGSVSSSDLDITVGSRSLLARLRTPADLIEGVAAVTRLRDGVGNVVLRHKDDFFYLVVFGTSGETWAVGVVDGPLDPASLDAFVTRVHRPLQSRDPMARSELVHTGPAADELVRAGRRQGVVVKTWAEYQNLLDLSAYQEKLRQRLAADELYPQDLYLSQRYRPVDKSGQPHGDVDDELAETVLDDLLADDPRFVLVLGDPGFGKSFLIRRLTHLLLQGTSGVTPVVILLREAEKGHSLDEMVAGALASTSAYFQSDRFRRMFRGGRIALLVDGYDEFAIRVGYDRAAEQLRTFLRAIDGQSKILLTTRPSHFRRKREAVSQVFEDVLDLDVNQRRVYELEPFDQDQQREFLQRWFALHGDDAAPGAANRADQWMEALGKVDNLPELAQTPRMLSFMAAYLTLAQIQAAGEQQGRVTAARLYEMLVERWLTTETEKFATPSPSSRASGAWPTRAPGLGCTAATADVTIGRTADAAAGGATDAAVGGAIARSTGAATGGTTEAAAGGPTGTRIGSAQTGASHSGAGRAEAAPLASDEIGGVLASGDRWRVAEELALRLWSTGEAHVTEAVLEEVASAVLDLPSLGLTAAQAAQEIGSRTLLVGDGDERYFAHQSIGEFLLARKLAALLRKSDKPPAMGRAPLSDLTARFLRDLAPEEGVRWLRSLAEPGD